MERKQFDLKVLYVEDEEEVRLTLAKMLAKRVKRLVVAADGAEGLELFNREHPDLLITDIRMPKLNGLELAAKVLALRPSTPVIITSAHGDTEYLLEAIDLGVSQYVLKPINLERLLAAIEKCEAMILVKRQEMEIRRQADELRRLNEELQRLYDSTLTLSLHDHLSGLPNRRMLDHELNQTFSLSRRYGNPLSLIMLDIDHFKAYNDTEGHVAGDRMIQVVGGILGREIRSVDFACRYGGEEFLLLLPEIGTEGAIEVAERIRLAVMGETSVTISAGVAAYDAARHEQGQDLVAEADAALYKAKNRGRNRVEQGGGTLWNES